MVCMRLKSSALRRELLQGWKRVTWPSQSLPCTQVPSYPYYLANEPVHGQQQLEVIDKYSGQVAYRVSVASSEEIAR